MENYKKFQRKMKFIPYKNPWVKQKYKFQR